MVPKQDGQSNGTTSTDAKEPMRGGRHGKTINIFFVASGHLYERFLKIIILSAEKYTSAGQVLVYKELSLFSIQGHILHTVVSIRIVIAILPFKYIQSVSTFL